MTPQELLPLRGILIIGLFASFLLLIAKKRGFFTLTEKWSAKSPLAWYDLIVAFAIYFCSILFSPLLLRLFRITIPSQLELIAYINFAAFGLMPLLFWLYFGFIKKESICFLFKDHNGRSLIIDIFYGLFTYLLAVPLIYFLSEALALIVFQIFGTLGPEQNAVRVLRAMMSRKELLIPMVSIIIFIGPLIEEFLFRLLLQTYLRERLGRKAAILLTALAFSFLHFSKAQEVANFILLPMLFALGLFLSFIYEKQRSLTACLALHVTFNVATTSWLIYSS